MARATITLPNAFIDALESASTLLDTAADDVLNASAAVVEPRLRSTLSAAIQKHHHTVEVDRAATRRSRHNWRESELGG